MIMRFFVFICVLTSFARAELDVIILDGKESVESFTRGNLQDRDLGVYISSYNGGFLNEELVSGLLTAFKNNRVINLKIEPFISQTNEVDVKSLEVMAPLFDELGDLKVFGILANSRESLDFFQTVLPKMPSLETVWLNRIELNNDMINLLTANAARLQNLRVLDLSFNKISNENASSFSRLLAALPALEKVHLQGNEIEDKEKFSQDITAEGRNRDIELRLPEIFINGVRDIGLEVMEKYKMFF